MLNIHYITNIHKPIVNGINESTHNAATRAE
jgi:hypothetical protein